VSIRHNEDSVYRDRIHGAEYCLRCFGSFRVGVVLRAGFYCEEVSLNTFLILCWMNLPILPPFSRLTIPGHLLSKDPRDIPCHVLCFLDTLGTSATIVG